MEEGLGGSYAFTEGAVAERGQVGEDVGRDLPPGRGGARVCSRVHSGKGEKSGA